MISEAVRRSISLMKARLEDFDAGRIGLQRLVWDIEALISALAEEADADWTEELRSVWWRFELVNAIVIDEDRSELTAEEEEEVRDADRELRVLLHERART